MGNRMWARKRWGHGRLRQLATLCGCLIVGHAWRRCSENFRTCQRGCGAVDVGCLEVTSGPSA